MRFRMLGPLEVVAGDRSVRLGGIRQRATLGFLLLNTNRVVASSELIEALWPGGRSPQSARKILQNSVWRLRRSLGLGEGEGGVAELLSQPPGYMLRMEPDRTDLHSFRVLVDQGRAELEAGSADAATPLLHEAIGLWRGPALADLVETGIDWPELTSIQNSRLDALEDYFEAELACGNHHRVLVLLERAVATEPLRERLLGQLMLALYRSGRQTDALDVYHSARTTMVEKLGLEPARTLRSLQQAILSHDLELIPAGMRQQIELCTPPAPRNRTDRVLQPVGAGSLDVCLPPVEPAVPGLPEGRVLLEPPCDDEPVPVLPRPPVSERKDVSVLIVRAQPTPELDDVDPMLVDAALESMTVTIREEVECLGGMLAASIGSIWLALFDTPRGGKEDAERAVHTALTTRDRLCTPADPAVPPAVRVAAVQIAVATGEALVRHDPEQGSFPPSVTGALLDECHTLLEQTQAGEIRVCERTRRATEFAVSYRRGGDAGGWLVGGLRQEYSALHAVPVIDREYDLDVLRGLMQRTQHQGTPHLVTVLGAPGIGKTRFVMEFERRVAANPEAVRLVVARTDAFGGHPLEVLRDLLLSCCGILSDDSGTTAAAKLADTVERLAVSTEECRHLVARLAHLVDPDPAVCTSWLATGEVLEATRQFLGRAAAQGPLVLVVEDLHWADDEVVDFVEHLTTSLGALPLLVIATARPELLARRPRWGGGIRHSVTLVLEPISDAAIDRLIEFLMSTSDSGLKNSAGGLLAALKEGAGDEPAVRRDQLRRILASGSASLRDERCAGGNGWHFAPPELCVPRSAGHPNR